MQQDLNEVIFGSESLEQCAIDGSVSICFCLSMSSSLPKYQKLPSSFADAELLQLLWSIIWVHALRYSYLRA